MTFLAPRVPLIALFVTLLSATGIQGEEATPVDADARSRRQRWYWDTVVNLHLDNHSLLLGRGKTAEHLADMYRDVPVEMIQVSAYGNRGDTITYQSEVLEHLEQQPTQGDWDTLATWGAAVRKLGKRFHIYINTRGMNVHKRWPRYMQQDAQGKGRGRGKGLYDACPRPAPDGDGYLETFLLPLLREIVEKYEPGGIWIDGDHARTRTCYCKNCRRAWREETGRSEPPTDPSDPDWPRWLALEQKRYDDYRKRMAEVIHQTRPETMYTSNHSWRKTYGTRFEKIDPRSAPPWVDSYSADLSHGNSIRETRLSSMLLSPEEETPYDIMHLVNRDQKISPGRVLQQGGMTFASGGAWLLWIGGGTAIKPHARSRARRCSEFAQARSEALGHTFSLNPVAVLSSETSWLEERIGGKEDYYDFQAANHAALALQDACYGVDLVNEHILRRRLDRYRVIVVPNQRKVASETLEALIDFAEQGGLVLVTGFGLADHDVDDFLGLRRIGIHGESAMLRRDGMKTRLDDFVEVSSTGAKVKLFLGPSHPLLLVRSLGKGKIAYFAGTEIPDLDYDGLLPFLMKKLRIGPMATIGGAKPQPHLVFAFREKEDRTVIHITDLTSRVGGKRVPAGRTDLIDDPNPLESITVRLPWPERPKRITVVPEETEVAWDWSDDRLDIHLQNMEVHAALILESSPKALPGFLSPELPLAKRFPWVHYDDLFTIKDGFERSDHGHAIDPLAAYQIRTGGKTRIRLVEENPADGRYCVQFIDSPDAPKAFYPYFSCRPKQLNRGTGHFAVDLRITEGATPALDFRTVENRRDYPAGPGLHFRDGQIIAVKKGPLCRYPENEWFNIDITFPLGSGKYDFVVRVPDAEPIIFHDLPCYSGADFQECGWIGITGNGKANASFFIDHLLVERID
jgi:hypothetical protein